MRVANRTIRWPRQLMEKVDKVASDLNVVLIVFAVGLATLDFTFMVTQVMAVSRSQSATYPS